MRTLEEKLKWHVGAAAIRLTEKADNPREVAFSKQWQKEQKNSQILAWLIGKEFSERDAKVAATVIQWLGSNIGMSFLQEVIKSEPKVAVWFERVYTNKK